VANVGERAVLATLTRENVVDALNECATALSRAPCGGREIPAVFAHPVREQKVMMAANAMERPNLVGHVNYSREQLAARFAELDEALNRLASADAAEEERWLAFERLVHLPAASIAEADRRWWWEQVYATMERHGLTELSRLSSSGRR